MIKGRLVQILPIEVGVSKAGKEWKKRNFIIDTGEKYNPLICFQLFGDKTDIIEAYTIGQEIEVSYNLSSKEFGGKWYSSIDAWKITPVGNVQQQTKVDPTIAIDNGDIGDLPF